MTALVIALALGALAGGMISVALALEDYEDRTPSTLAFDEWQRLRAERGAATMVAAALTAADAVERLFEVARRTAIWLAPRNETTDRWR